MFKKIKFLNILLLLLAFLGPAPGYTYTRDWDEADPIDHTLNRNWPDEIRDVKEDVSNRLTGQVYGFASGENTEGFKKVLFPDVVSAPSTATDKSELYGIAVNSKTQLRLKDEDGIVIGVGTPIGAVVPYAGASAPSGWLFCDGSAVSRTTYADLFAVLGTAWGVGDGSTTFNVPNIGDRHIEGKGSTLSTLAATGGATTHDHGAASGSTTLTAAQSGLPSHTHPIPVTFSTGLGGGAGFSYSTLNSQEGTLTSGSTGGTAASSGHTHTITSGSSYSPYVVLNHIIKY